jgi:hypothetical protein
VAASPCVEAGSAENSKRSIISLFNLSARRIPGELIAKLNCNMNEQWRTSLYSVLFVMCPHGLALATVIFKLRLNTFT